MSGTAAEDRVLRTIARLFGVAGAVFGLLTVPAMVDQVHRTPIVWTVAASVGTLGIPVALGLLAVWAAPSTLRRVGLLAAVGNLAALATVALVFDSTASAAESPWVLQLTALGTTGGALALSVPLIAADVVLTSGLVVLDRLLTGSPALTLVAVQDGLYSLLFDAIFVGLAVGALRAGRAVDAVASTAAAATTAARDEQVRSDEKARVDGLVHDYVLATLLVTAQTDVPAATTARAASDALQRLRQLASPHSALSPSPVPVEALFARLRALLTALAPEGQYVASTDEVSGALPLDVVDAVVGAAGEALRNCRRHAGVSAAVELHVAVEDGALEVAVIDDGIGFAVSSVAADRLGIATSIVGRLQSVGGVAEVRSHAGRGTAVLLRWPVS